MKEDTLSGLREQLSQKRDLEEKINGQTLGKLEAMKDGVEREIQERKGLLEELLTVE